MLIFDWSMVNEILEEIKDRVCINIIENKMVVFANRRNEYNKIMDGFKLKSHMISYYINELITDATVIHKDEH